jgi:TusA-related sulfurtransferase
MTPEELNALAVEKEVDARGTACPGPLLEAKRAVAEVSSGGVMTVVSSDCGTPSDISRWATKTGHEYLGDVEEDGCWRVYVRVK